MPVRRLLVVSLIAVAGCRGGAPPAPAAPVATVVPANAVVTHVVDGDTIDVTVDGSHERVRLIGIDTPEIAHAGSPERPGNPAECYGPEAAAFTAGLLPAGTAVRLERDVVGRDDYGRVLAYVYRASDGLFVNLDIVRAGFAQPLSISPNTTHRDTFVAAARAADAAGAGLWSACG